MVVAKPAVREAFVWSPVLSRLIQTCSGLQTLLPCRCKHNFCFLFAVIAHRNCLGGVSASHGALDRTPGCEPSSGLTPTPLCGVQAYESLPPRLAHPPAWRARLSPHVSEHKKQTQVPAKIALKRQDFVRHCAAFHGSKTTGQRNHALLGQKNHKAPRPVKPALAQEFAATLG